MDGIKFKINNKIKISNEEIEEDVCNINMSGKEYCRIYAVDKTFSKVDFSKSIFNSCYFRNCKFNDCNFLGSEFIDSNLRGSQFENCIFKYSRWSRTLVEDYFLDNCLPPEENLSRDLLRELRINAIQLGNNKIANRAAIMEIKNTGAFYRKAAWSKEAYYRSKYKKKERAVKIYEHVAWMISDVAWGHGESLLRLVRSVLVLLIMLGIVNWKYTRLINEEALWSNMMGVMFYSIGITGPYLLINAVKVVTSITSIVGFGAFISIMIKRLSYR